MPTLELDPISPDAIRSTSLPLPGRRQGKVRDVYRLPPADGEPARVVIVATDRLSAFDVVLPTPIPGKGRLLTAMSLRWFDRIRRLGIVHDHLLCTDAHALPGLDPQTATCLEGRLMIGRAARVVPVECVVRGYLAGSGWVEYEQHGTVCGIRLPHGLRRCDRLPEPIFTPATKATEGHDENIDFDAACAIAGRPTMERLRDLSLRIYMDARDYAADHGLLLADTKFEFGFAEAPDGTVTDELLLVDEVLTPDSSRYWPADAYEPGREQDSFDKQFVRNWLLELVARGAWDKTPPGPVIPPDIVAATTARYREAYERLFGQA